MIFSNEIFHYLQAQWNDSDKPFRYIIFDDILEVPAAEEILQEYPDVESGNWDGATYIHQKNKFSLKAFRLLNTQHLTLYSKN
jgi:hypothetical protein